MVRACSMQRRSGAVIAAAIVEHYEFVPPALARLPRDLRTTKCAGPGVRRFVTLGGPSPQAARAGRAAERGAARRSRARRRLLR
jgi:hypothetical protein